MPVIYTSGFHHQAAEEIPTAGNWHIDPNNEGYMTTPDRLEEWARPYHAHEGLICIDWEGGLYDLLKAGGGIQNALKVLYQVKVYCPLAKVGYYGIPLREYWHQDHDWIDSASHVMPIVKASDVLFPSIYDFYNTNEARDHDRAARYVRLCTMLHRSVVPFTHHRYHPSNPTVGNKLIPAKEQVDQIRACLLPGVDGFCAWSGDKWLYEHDLTFAATVQEEFIGDETVDSWNQRTNEMAVERIRKAVA